MKKIIQKNIFYKLLNKHPYACAMVVITFIFVGACFSLIVVNAETVGPSDSRIINLYDGEKSLTLPTRATTVGELINITEISLSDSDLVVPSLDTEITEDNFQINIYRAKPFTIVDGNSQFRVLSPHQSPELIVQNAGIELFAEDTLNESVATNFLRDGFIGSTITINRSVPVTVNLYGNILQYRTQQKTVKNLLDEKSITLAEGDNITPSADSTLVSGANIVIARFGTKIESVEEEINFSIVSEKDSNLPAGQTVIKTPGQKGKKVATYEIALTNNVETGRKLLHEVIASEPVAQVQVIGSKITDTSDNVELGRQIASEMGYADQFECIYNIFNRESRWNHLARNRNSGAYGIPQALPGSKMGPGWESDPEVQIRWGINYMARRYGSPCGAWDFWTVNHWY